MFEIRLSKQALKKIKKIDQRYQVAIFRKIEQLKKNPYLGKKLTDNLKEFRSIREGVYRIIYKIKKKDLIVFIISVNHRQGVYRKLK